MIQFSSSFNISSAVFITGIYVLVIINTSAFIPLSVLKITTNAFREIHFTFLFKFRVNASLVVIEFALHPMGILLCDQY